MKWSDGFAGNLLVDSSRNQTTVSAQPNTELSLRKQFNRHPPAVDLRECKTTASRIISKSKKIQF